MPDVRDKVAKLFFDKLDTGCSVARVIFTGNENGVKEGIITPLNHPYTIDHPHIQHTWKMAMISFAEEILKSRTSNRMSDGAVILTVTLNDLEYWLQKQHEELIKNLLISLPFVMKTKRRAAHSSGPSPFIAVIIFRIR